jgi:Fe-S cluster biosynthesis and repair protein YggX
MSQIQERIAQFRKMASDDPDNELGHFRLGQLLMEAGELEEAVQSFRRTLELSPQFAKVFQLLGQCLVQLNRRDEAVKVLKEGFVVADTHGHNKPRDEMADLLKSLGEAVPETNKPAAGAGGVGGFQCRRPGCYAGTQARQLPRPPINDEIGERIYNEICADCWNEWLRNHSVKIINENRLDLSREDHVAVLDDVMFTFFGFK